MSDATLADVYALDMGQRTVDLPMWERLIDPGDRVVEVGAGNWRIARHLLNRERRAVRTDLGPVEWVGIELSNPMLERFWNDKPKRARAVEGDAALPRSWKTVCQMLARSAASTVPDGKVVRGYSRPFPDIVIVPYSTLFLLQHGAQHDLMRHISKLTGARVAVEVFEPVFDGGPGAASHKLLPQPVGPSWRRVSTPIVYPGFQRTRMSRNYYDESKPKAEGPQLSIEERIYWRSPVQVVDLMSTHLERVEMSHGRDIPEGMILVTGVAPGVQK